MHSHEYITTNNDVFTANAFIIVLQEKLVCEHDTLHWSGKIDATRSDHLKACTCRDLLL